MKRLLLLLSAALMLSSHVFAQTAAPKAALKASAKAASKPASPAAAEPALPKTPMLTREELRACKGQVVANGAEAKAINAAQAVLDAERDEVKKTDEAMRLVIKERNATMAAMSQERAELLKAGEGLNAKLKEAKKEEGEAMVADHNAKATDFTARADSFNQAGASFKTQLAAHGERIEKYNQSKNELTVRVEAYNRNIEAWKASCADRRYDEADEIAIKNGK